jgi:hypothetical protein
MNWHFRRRARRARPAGRGVATRTRLALEILEDRSLPSVTAGAVSGIIMESPAPNGGPSPNLPGGFSPAQIAQAYGFNQVTFINGTATVAGDGSGQTIAIVDAYDAPTIASDLATFDSTYGLPAPPSFSKVNETGGTTYPTGTSWANEISLDVEWAHAVAPGANILLVEANTNSWSDMFTAVRYAASQPGVSVVSMSWGGSQVNFDSSLQTPSGHNGVTFVASSGDSSALEYPADSPNVLGVGGTNLNIDSSGNYLGETGWGGSGGGICTAYSQPTYQKGVVTQSTTNRTSPDVAYAASNFPICLNGGWSVVGGTSCAAPQWAALVAIADQGRALAGKASLDGFSQTLPALYGLASSGDFHDITSGGSGSNSCGPGYDLVTGIGSPRANLIVPALVSYGGSTSGSGPTITAPASATPNPVTGTSTTLSVQASENGSASGLSYAWSVTAYPAGARLPTFANGGAASTTATFYQAGAYTFQVSVTDSANHSATSSVNVTVNQTFTKVGVAPSATSVSDGSTKQFTATALDQFGQAMATQPTAWTWALAAGSGTVSTRGVYTAPSSGSGSASVKATANARSGNASVSYGTAPAAPSNLAVTSSTKSYVSLSWVDNATNATGYVIQRSTNGSSWTQVGTVGANATTFTDRSVSPNKTYYYRVYAYNSFGNSAYSNVVQATVTPHIEVEGGAPASGAVSTAAGAAGPVAEDGGGIVVHGAAAVPGHASAPTPEAAALPTTGGNSDDGLGVPSGREQAAESQAVVHNSAGGLTPGRPGARMRLMQGWSWDASSGSDLGS